MNELRWLVNHKQHKSVQHTWELLQYCSKQTTINCGNINNKDWLGVSRLDWLDSSLCKIDDFQVLQVYCVTWVCCVHTGFKYFQCTPVSGCLYKYWYNELIVPHVCHCVSQVLFPHDCSCVLWLISVLLTHNESPDSRRRLRHKVTPAHAHRAQTTGGVLQQTHPAPSGGGASQGIADTHSSTQADLAFSDALHSCDVDCWCVCVQAGVRHVILAVSYMSDLLEREMRAQEQRVFNEHSCLW